MQPSRYHLDPLAQMFGTYATWTPDDVRPITSVWAVESAGTLTVSQRCAPGSLLVLGIGPLLLPPIQDLNGMLAVDPAQALL